MSRKAPQLMAAREAARVLLPALKKAGQDFTIADAATRSGLPLRDAELGLHALLDEYRGHLRVGRDGDLVFRFPDGFTKPWIVPTALGRAASAVGRGLGGLARFIVRAWIAVVLIGYVALFVALLIALTFARSSSDDSRGGRGLGLGGYFLLRIIADALFWTFHPFSPVALSYGEGSRRRSRRRDEEQSGPPFYEKVNRFFFGPDAPVVDPRETERRLVAEIRAQKGRIGLADVMRVTGLARDDADPLMSRLMLDYDGSVEVTPAGAIVYRFEEIRKTAEPGVTVPRPQPVWSQPAKLPPLTGNGFGSNLLIVLLNGFNLVASLYALDAHFTLDRVWLLIQGVPLDKLPPAGTAIALGIVPLVFSIALFALPLLRAAVRPLQARRVGRKNAQLAVLRGVLTGLKKGGVSEDELRRAWRAAAGAEPSSRELTRQVVRVGGDVDVDPAGKGVRYRFPDLESEAAALETERQAASEDEKRIGPVAFTTED